MEGSSAQGGQVDEDLYSRQLYAIGGHTAQRALSGASVLIVGLGGVGAEIAKNLCLMGVRQCELFDPAPTTWLDLAGNFYLAPEDVGHPRAARCLKSLQALNPYVSVGLVPEGALSAGVLSRFSVVVAADCSGAEAAALGGWAREAGKQFILAEARGGFGRVFTDLGPAHTVDDMDGTEPVSGLVGLVTLDEVGAVTVLQDTRHGLSVGDWVVFTEVRGATGLNDGVPRRVLSTPSPATFTLGEAARQACPGQAYAGGGSFTTVKMPVTLAFQPLSALLRPVGAPGGPPDDSIFSVTDFAKLDRPALLHAAFCALHAVGTPAPGDEAGARRVVEEALRLFQGGEGSSSSGSSSAAAASEAQRGVVAQFARGAAGVLSPFCAAVGGIAGQEVIKGITGKFTPLRQWLYLDISEALPPAGSPLPQGEVAPLGDRYDGQAGVIGRSAQGRLGALNYFLVGAGAIGCEVMKNWALMGLGCGAGGCITLTDMDRIERSNLSRQFLFRNSDIGRLKSTTAVNAAVAMNAGLRALSYETRVGEDSEGVFSPAFWARQSGVCTALDNVEARLYIDKCCLKHKVPMLDSGTQGTMGSTQVVYPWLTENYGARRDPPAEGIPVCTLNDFPYKIVHTLAWARDWFEGEFKQVPESVNDYLSKPNFLEALKAQTNNQIETLKKLLSALVHERPTTLEQCVTWSCQRFAELYRNRIMQLRHKFPQDTRTSAGDSFWSGTKRFPTPLALDFSDAMQAAFITTSTRLRGSLYGLSYNPSVHTQEWFAKCVREAPVPAFTPSDSAAIPTSEAEVEEMKKAAAAAAAAGGGGWDVQAMAEELAKQLPSPSSLAGFRCTPVEFEKDDDLHISWVTACSNLRARNYAVKEEDKHTSRGIAGKIIPAIATTTALVSGLICCEIYKLVGAEALTMERLRTASLNLATAMVALSEPMAPKRNLLTLPPEATLAPPQGSSIVATPSGGRAWAWSAWDSLTLQGPLTLQGVLDFVKHSLGRTATWVNVGSVCVFSNLTKKSQVKERLPRVISDIFSTISKGNTGQASQSRSLVLNISVEDEVVEGVQKPVDFPEFRYLLGPDELREQAGGAIGGGGGGGGGGSGGASSSSSSSSATGSIPRPSAVTPALQGSMSE